MEIKKLKKNALVNPEGDTELSLRKMIGGKYITLDEFKQMDRKGVNEGE